MPRKVLIIADPGIDTAFAVALALSDPALDVVGLIPTAGNVAAEQATANVHTLIDVLDPPKWPRTASALATKYDTDGTALHGPGGLGGVNFPCATRHTLHPADKVLCDILRESPREVSVICLGPLTTLAAALDREAALATLIDQTVIVGGTWREPGNAGPMAEFHIHLDPGAAKRVLKSDLNPILIPLDVSRRLMLSPSDLLGLPNAESKTCQFLRQIVPFGIRASSNLYGVEGFHLKDVLGVAALSLSGCLTTEAVHADVETQGELTRGMVVIDARPQSAGLPNVQLATGAAIGEVRQYMDRILKQAT